MTVAATVDPDDPTPPYEQLRRQLAGYITTGELPAGTRLSPVRQLAADLDLANGTVARAYRELEAAGLVHTRRGAGTTVLEQSPEATGEARRARLAALAAALVADTRRLQIDDADALAAVEAAQHGGLALTRRRDPA